MGNYTMFLTKDNTTYYLKNSFNNCDRLMKEIGFANLEFIKKPFKRDYVISVPDAGIIKYVDSKVTTTDINIILHKDKDSSDNNIISIMDGEDELVKMEYVDKLSTHIFTYQEVLKRVLCGTDELLRDIVIRIDKELSDED